MEKEWLLMTMVTADKNELNNGGNVFAFKKSGESGYFDPSRLINSADLDYGYPKKGDMFFSVADEKWKKASGDFNEELTERFLVLRKLRDELQEWEDRCPLTEWSPEMREKLIDWLKDLPEATRARYKDGIEIGKGE